MLRNTPSSTLFPYTTLFRSGDIRQQKSSHFVCNLSQSLVVPIPRISRCSADDHLRHDGQGFLFYFVIVNHAGLLLHAVEMRLVEFSREVYRRAVSQVSPVRKVKTQDCITRL